MVRRLTFLLALVLVRAAHAADISGDADHASVDAREAVWTGHARAGDGTFLIMADEIRYLFATDVATATGHVTLTQGAERLLADKLVYHRRDGSFVAQGVRAGSFPVYVEGTSAAGTMNGEITVEHATATYGEPGLWQPTLTAEQIIYSPGKKLRAEHASLGIGPARAIPLPHFEQNLHETELSVISLVGGYRPSLGAYVQAGLHLPALPGWKLGGELGYYTARGVMFGPSGDYTSPDDPAALAGSFRSGFINDHGDKLTDVLGRPVPENRGYFEWEHRQQLSDNLSLAGQLNYWKDSEIVRDFRPDSFSNVQQPDSYAESVYTGRNYFLSLFARIEPNNFEIVQQRLPELNFDLLPLAVGGGIYEQFHAGAALLREDPPAGGPTLRSDRLDAYYGLTRPLAPTDWLSFTPVAGARITHYANTEGALVNGDYTRTLGELGFDAQLRSSATFDYKNDIWKIDGLRHLFTPILSYRYIPEGGDGRSHIPLIDREAFTTYLPPLGLDVTRNIDDLHALNTLRIGFDNTVQTRDPVYGSRDLLTLNTAADYHFKRQPGDKSVSSVHTEFAVMPAPWIRLDLYETFDPKSVSQDE
ncbi:MAG: LPS assembly protein LptD, partial [Pseudomonadota bacterium]